MKKINIIYWIFTVLFAGVMLLTGIQHAMATPDVVKMISTDMGFPLYMVSFLGWVKILGAIAILIPGFPRVAEWAYAGLFFDLIGAFYAILAVGTPFVMALGMAPFFIVGIVSYIYYHKRLKALATQQ
jgi:uncharacterized membrane protein